MSKIYWVGIPTVIGIAGCAFAAMPYIPGTDAHSLMKAKAYIRKLTKDPSSAIFEKVALSKKSGKSDLVCGQVNGRNGFGAYSGFRGFIYDASIGSGDIDPNVTQNFDDLSRAYDLCNQLGNQVCETGDKIKEDRAYQRSFNATWRARCDPIYRGM